MLFANCRRVNIFLNYSTERNKMSRLSANQSDIDFQNEILKEVSRTFALTIPKLPASLMPAVANAYLLCRIADTIEDDPALSFEEKKRYSDWFAKIVEEKLPADDFSNQLASKLGPETTDAELLLIQKASTILRITNTLSNNQRKAMFDCVKIMTEGMVLYQNKETLDGVENQSAMDLYCYYVAGVVGEMLTKIFLEYGNSWDETSKETMLKLSTSFGQGLQMTNILKDVWSDRRRGACWIPRDIFEKENIVLSQISNGNTPGFRRCLKSLIAISLAHLQNALDYTLSIPRRESGIRLFCLWALFMAVLTLTKIYRDPSYTNGKDIKISRSSVKIIMSSTMLFSRSNSALRILFFLLTIRIPKAKKLVTTVYSEKISK